MYTLDFENNLGEDKNYLIHIDARYIENSTGDTLEWESMRLDTRPDPRITTISIPERSSGIIVTDESSSSSSAALSDIQVLTKSFSEGSKWAPISKRVRVESLSPELAQFYLSVDAHSSGAPDLLCRTIIDLFKCK